MHMSIAKDMWNYLEEVYSGKNILKKAFDVILFFEVKRVTNLISILCRFQEDL